MNMKKNYVFALLLSFSYLVYGETINTGDLPGTALASKVPEIVSKRGEVIIAKSFSDADPTTVLASLVNTKTGELFFLENYLVDNPNPKIESKSEILFKNLIEKNVANSASYLGFVSGSLTDSSKAEITLMKNSFISISSKDIKLKELKDKVSKFPNNEINDYGLIIGYTEFILTADIFSEAAKKADATGYGAKIGTKWYNKSNNFSSDKVVVALYSPLRLLLPKIELNPMDGKSLNKILESDMNRLSLPKIDSFKVKD